MFSETKEDFLEKILSRKKPICPYCKKEMSIWEVPQIALGDGLGWGTPFMYVCFNDECPPFVNGWSEINENYAYKASCRCVSSPDSPEIFDFMSVFGSQGGKGQIYDENTTEKLEQEKEAMKKGFAHLAESYANKDDEKVLEILINSSYPKRVKLKAAEIIGDIGSETSIEPLINAKFANRIIKEKVDESIAKLHEKHFTRECPFCAEIIKKRAKICKHCQSNLT